MNIYIYDVPELKAVKIGKGNNPSNRMMEYCQEHNINPDVTSLQFWYVGDTVDQIERWIHKTIGLEKLYHGRAIELFLKDRETFKNIVARIKQLIATNHYCPVNVVEPKTIDFQNKEAVADALLKWVYSDLNKRLLIVESQARGRPSFIEQYRTQDNEEIIAPWSGIWATAAIVFRNPSFAESCLGFKITVNGNPITNLKLTEWLYWGEYKDFVESYYYWNPDTSSETVKLAELDINEIRELIAKKTEQIMSLKAIEKRRSKSGSSNNTQKFGDIRHLPINMKQNLPVGSHVRIRCLTALDENYEAISPLTYSVRLNNTMNAVEAGLLLDGFYHTFCKNNKLNKRFYSPDTMREIESGIYDIDVSY